MSRGKQKDEQLRKHLAHNSRLISSIESKDDEIAKLQAELDEASGLIAKLLEGVDIFVEEFIPAFKNMLSESGGREHLSRLNFIEADDSVRQCAHAFLYRRGHE